MKSNPVSPIVPPCLEISPADLAPPGKFSLVGLVTVAEVEKLQAMETELARLFGLMERRRPTAVKDRAHAARLAADRDPSEENMQRLVKANRELDYMNDHALRHGAEQRAARKVVWRYYNENVRAFVVEILRRGLAAMEAEHTAQLAREKVWEQKLQWLAAWFERYRMKFALARLDLPSGRLAALVAELRDRSSRTASGCVEIPAGEFSCDKRPIIKNVEDGLDRPPSPFATLAGLLEGPRE